jgi:hypothetical protein
MPNDTEIVTSTAENEMGEGDETLAQEEREFQPGELCAFDATNDQVSLESDDDENGFTDEEKKGCVSGLASKVAQRDLVSRRLQVRDAWKARYFWRGNQHLLAGRNGAWVLPQMVQMGGQSYDDHGGETNMYLAFGDTITASLTAATPSVRFEPEDPKNPAGITAAEQADKAKMLIERSNNCIVLQEDMARYFWTDGLCFVYTRHVLDAQRFGYTHPDLDEVHDELSYLPELGGEGPEGAPKGAQSAPAGASGGSTGRGNPRGSEVIRVFGTLEVKAPMQANDLDASDYVQWSEEIDVNRGKTMYPEVADEIQASTAPTAESDYERLARTSIMMGMRPSNMTNDSMTYNCTIQRTWVRPAFYVEEKNDDLRNWLYDNFPKGMHVVMIGSTVCEARNEAFSDHWVLIHARPGDGMHRPALGTPLIPLQEKLNDCMDLVHESFMHLIPIKWVDSEGLDANALADIQSRPNTYLKMKRRVDKALADNFFVEPQIQIADGLLTYIEKLFGEMAQFLCGAFPALFGGNTGSNDTAQGIASQRDQALGRIGLTWRNMRAGYAKIMQQAVMAAAEHRKEIMAGTIQGGDGTDLKIAIDPDDLKAKLLCFPDSDENFPESWVAQRMVWMNLLEQAKANPILAGILQAPRNQLIAKDKIGVPELVIPTAASSRKQLSEIMILLETGPVPNPALQEAEEKVKELFAQAQAQGIAADPNVVAQIQESIASIPPMVSTVPIGKLDNHQIEVAEISTWANDPEGIRAAATNPDGFQNVMTHYDEHMAAIAEAAKGNPPAAAEKPVSESLNFKDLPPEGQVQLAAKAGIKLDLAKLQQDAAQDRAAAIAKAAAPRVMPHEGTPEAAPVVQ